jgi:peptide/nickel transport system substrate-binding protein
MHREGRWVILFLLLFPFAISAGGVLRIAIPTFPARLNPVYATDETSQAVLNKLHQGLFSFDCDGRPVNELADTVNLDAHRLQIDIRLRRGIRFSSGAELEAADVVATFRLLRNPLYEYPYPSDLECLTSITELDRYRVRVQLRSPFAPWRNYLTFKILSAAEINRLGPEEFRRTIPGGCGWYKLESREAPLRVVLTRNPFRPDPGLYSRIEFSVLLDTRQAPLKLLTGETDAAELFAEDAHTYKQMEEWQRAFRLIRFRKFGYLYLVFNLRRGAVDLGLRRLVQRTIVQGPFLDLFLNGNGRKTLSPFLYLTDPPSVRLPALPPPLRRAPLTILCNSETPLRRNLVLFVCEEMRRQGVELEPVFLEYQMFLARLKGGDFDLAISGFLLDLDWNLSDVLASGGMLNYAGYRNSEMDQLMERGLSEMDEEKRRKIYGRAHERWAIDLPFLPLFTSYSAVGVARHVRVPDRLVRLMGSTGDFFYNIEEWRR